MTIYEKGKSDGSNDPSPVEAPKEEKMCWCGKMTEERCHNPRFRGQP